MNQPQETKTIELIGGPIDGERHRVPVHFGTVNCTVSIGADRKASAIYRETSRTIDDPELGTIACFRHEATIT